MNDNVSPAMLFEDEHRTNYGTPAATLNDVYESEQTPEVTPDDTEVISYEAPEETPKIKRSKKKSSNLKLHPEIQKLLQTQAEKCGLTQAAYITVLVVRNADDADKAGFEREVKNAKRYLR